MPYSSLRSHTKAVLSLLPLKIPNPLQLIRKPCSVSEYALFFETELVLVCYCYDYYSHSSGLIISPRTAVNFIALYYAYISVKTVSLIGSRETSHCP